MTTEKDTALKPLDQLKYVLCDPEGKCCIAGSDEDRAIVDRALQALEQQVQEPVADAWMHKDGRLTDAKAKTARAENFHGWRPMAFITLTTQPAQPAVQEPVAHINNNGVVHAAGYPWGEKENLRPLVFGDTPPAQPVARADAEAITGMPAVDEVIRALLDDKTADNATAVVQAILGAVPPEQPAPAPVPLTERELELIDGMIAVQLDHAARCDSIANRTMAEKQKGWDMERVALLQKLKEKNT